MKTKINEFIDFIKNKTSVPVSVYDLSGNMIAGEKSFPDRIKCDVGDIYADKENNYTVFKIKLSDNDFLASICGDDEYAVKIAKLIHELSKSFSSNPVKMTKKEFFISLLFGEVNFSVAEKYIKKFAVPDKKCFAVAVVLPEHKCQDTELFIEDYIDAKTDVVVKTAPDVLTVVRFFSGNDNEYKSPTEYADFLLKSIHEECGVKGSAYTGMVVKTPYELNASYALAVESMACAEILGNTGSAHSFKEYILTKAVREFPPQKTDEYCRLLVDDEIKNIFVNKEIIETAEAFLESNLNASETARKLYIHRNTLMYRLEKIEKVTGLNIRNFSDAVTFRFITILYKASKR